MIAANDLQLLVRVLFLLRYILSITPEQVSCLRALYPGEHALPSLLGHLLNALFSLLEILLVRLSLLGFDLILLGFSLGRVLGYLGLSWLGSCLPKVAKGASEGSQLLLLHLLGDLLHLGVDVNVIGVKEDTRGPNHGQLILDLLNLM